MPDQQNLPATAPQFNVPPSTPTIGALLGGTIGTLVAGAVPAIAPIAQVVFPTLFAWLFHVMHARLGTPE